MASSADQHTDPAIAVVTALEKENARAFVAGDIERLDELWSDSLLVNSPVNRVHDKQRVLELLRNGVITHVLLENDIEAIRREGDTVTVMGSEVVRDKPDSPILRRRYTNLWRREGETWRIFIRHANIVADTGGSTRPERVRWG
jgi:ketosteroid isomerase-like protein